MKPADLQRQFFEMLTESQYWPPATLVDYQRSQLAQLLRHGLVVGLAPADTH